MFCNPDILPSDPNAEVIYLGGAENVIPEFHDDIWDHVGTVKAERVHLTEGWQFSSEVPHDLNPGREGFWMWGDVLIRVIPATILESGLYFFKNRSEAKDA